MKSFIFTKLTDLDDRSIFANAVLQLIYDKHNGDLNLAIKEAEPLFGYFE